MTNLRMIYHVFASLCFPLIPTIYCMENLQNNEVIGAIVIQHTERLNRTEEQLNQLIDNFYNFVNFTNTLVPIGAIMEYSGTGVVPNNWLECNGEYKRQDQYNELFQVIQDTYGQTRIININGQAFSTFKLPDRRGKVAVGIGSDNSTGGLITNATAQNLQLGQSFGKETHTLKENEMPSHSHGGITHDPNLKQIGIAAGGHNLVSGDSLCNGKAGGDQPHNNTQPSIFMKFYIRAK